MSDGTFTRNAAVLHPRFGRGRVIADEGDTVVVRFDVGIQECPRDELSSVADLAAPSPLAPSPPLGVVTRVLAAAIRSTNDAWGVFSNSRIDLLPHQLWVCRRVIERWPSRWLVADDVGLGKTIEAGLILTPLRSSGRVRRLLVLAPASLVEQWQARLRGMFDLRLARYTAEADTARSDFWGTHDFVVASAQTLRNDRNERWRRMLEATPWDLVMVDEAHHMNADEKGGPTLAYQLVEQLQERGRIRGLVLFTGTPHRGKDFGFLSLLKLLQPERFDPKRPISEQLHLLRDVMIRNNKRVVTDMTGKALFQKVSVFTERYTYSSAEQEFYDRLTSFILSGRAYASKLDATAGRAAMLVLISMQKLASSSVAAIRRAIAGRLERLRAASKRAGASEVAELRRRFEQLQSVDDPADADLRAELEERLAEEASEVRLGGDEAPALEYLIELANIVEEETKVRRIVELLDARFAGRSVLLFTEYKATQSLVLSALLARFGDGCVTFINGDGRADGVKDRAGRVHSMALPREEAARRFQCGEVRFLVSTEAAGEGIDLQACCYTLIQVDLPWNPMRLHQRVGRVDRYGQRHAVEVVNLHNPETVEGRIWDCLNEKLTRITQAFGSAMDDPEDMLQLVLGMSPSGQFDQLFAEAANIPGDRLRAWFDARTATFGGRSALDAVRDLVGHASRFDFGAASAGLPKVELRDLLPFFKASLQRHRRQWKEGDEQLSFKTPELWCERDFAVLDAYERLLFRRESGAGGGIVCGVGHRVFDQALADADTVMEVLAVVPELDEPLAVFAVHDKVTTGEGLVRRVVFGVSGATPDWRLLADWELLLEVNRVARRPQSLARLAADRPATLMHSPSEHTAQAGSWLMRQPAFVALSFKSPGVDPLALLVPTAAEANSVTDEALS